MTNRIPLLLLVCALPLVRVAAQDQPPTATAPAGEGTNAPVKDLGNGQLQIGKVIVNPRERTVTFPTVVNMNNGLVEYFLVSDHGKVHESILRSDAEPYHIHLGMLLLGARAATDADPMSFEDLKKNMPGDEIAIEVAWNDGKRNTRKRADELVQDAKTGRAISRSHWVYNGSRFIDRTFSAQRDGSIVSLITDAYALINNPRAGRENDEIWMASTNRVPPLNTPVAVTIKLEKIWKGR